MFRKISYEFILDTSRRNQQHESEVMLKASQGKAYVCIPTSVYCLKSQFTDGRINATHSMSDGLNAMLTQILSDVQASEIEAFRKDIQCSVQTIYSMYVDHLNASLPLVEFCEAIMKYSPNRRQITKDKYVNTVKKVDMFSPNISLENIDLNWLKRFEVHCLAKGNSDSTVWSCMKVLRTMFNEAIKRDLLKPWQTPFKMYEIPELRSRTDVLRWPEVEQMMDFSFVGKDRRYNRVRDVFCFACLTGLRVSDLLALKNENIVKTGEVTWLRMHTQKTGAYVQIPLSVIFYGMAMDILRKYSCIEDMCGYYKDRTPLNKAIPNMVKIIGVGGSQKISMHTARRTCVTALADFGVNVYTIQKIVGHARITTTQKYMQLSTQAIETELQRIFTRDTMKNVHEVVYVRRNGQKLYADSEFLRCAHCKHFAGGSKGLPYKCSLTKVKVHVYDWCRRFSERKEAAHEDR